MRSFLILVLLSLACLRGAAAEPVVPRGQAPGVSLEATDAPLDCTLRKVAAQARLECLLPRWLEGSVTATFTALPPQQAARVLLESRPDLEALIVNERVLLVVEREDADRLPPAWLKDRPGWTACEVPIALEAEGCTPPGKIADFLIQYWLRPHHPDLDFELRAEKLWAHGPPQAVSKLQAGWKQESRDLKRTLATLESTPSPWKRQRATLRVLRPEPPVELLTPLHLLFPQASLRLVLDELCVEATPLEIEQMKTVLEVTGYLAQP